MKQEVQSARDPRVLQAAAELEQLIRSRYPQAAFELIEGEDPPGARLRVTVDVEDVEPVRALYLDRLVELQVEEGIPIYLRTVQPPHRWSPRLGSPAQEIPTVPAPLR